MKLFTPPQQLRDNISGTIRRLKVQNIKLDHSRSRLLRRDSFLFENCALAIKRKNRERAVIFSNELAEVRRLLNIVVHSQLAIERIVLRLETLKELSDIIVDLKPALKMLKKTTKGLVGFMPDIAGELDNLNESINDTLVMTRVNSPHPITPSENKTLASEEILEEASSFLEQRLKEDLPPPPTPITKGVKSTKKVRQMIALTASCSGVEVCERKDPQKKVTYKDVRMKDLSFTINKSVIEETLLEYVKRCEGEVDVSQCATELNVPSEEVKKVLETLNKKGKIKIQC